MDRLLLTDGVPRIYTEGEIWPPNKIPKSHWVACSAGRVRDITPPVDKPEPSVVE